MGVTKHGGTLPGAVTPICNCCGVTLEFDVSNEEYEVSKTFWDNWKCPDCRTGKKHVAAPTPPPPTPSEEVMFFEKQKVKATITRNTTHPRENRLGYDQAKVEAITGDFMAMERIVTRFEDRFWKTWASGYAEDTGLPSTFLWKPSGISTEWDE